jgi:hypothetical protein
VARAVVACSDLLFGSKLYEGLLNAGHDVFLVDDEPGAWAAIREGADVFVVDLGSEDFDGAVLVDTMRSDGALRGVRTLGFFPHVDREARRRAEEVGFDLVVPRSRMAREMGELVERLAPANAGGGETASGGGPAGRGSEPSG